MQTIDEPAPGPAAQDAVEPLAAVDGLLEAIASLKAEP